MLHPLLRFFRRRRVSDLALDDVLFYWPDKTPFTVRDLLRSVEVKGITGSGKTSGSLKFFLEAICRHPKSALFLIAQKPEDKEFYQRIFKKHNKPLIVVELGGEYRCNLLETEMKAGADTRGLVEFLTALGESLEGGKGGREDEQFWRKLEERIIWGAVTALRLGGEVNAPNLLEFLSTAAYTRAAMGDAEWRKGYHPRVMEAAHRKAKAALDEADYKVAHALLTNEFPGMDDRLRGPALAGVMNTLHTFNTGLVRDICSTSTNFTPSMLDQGVSILVNFPFWGAGEHAGGPTARFIAGGLKYLVQKHCLRRSWEPGDFFTVLVMDEYQESATSMDAGFLSQCRSHGACLFTLTQTLHADYAALNGHGHHHKADQLLSNFGLHIYHAVDPDTAGYASKLLGQRREAFISYQQAEVKSWGEELFGQSPMRGNFSEQYQPVLQPNAFLGLRSGGKANNFKVDGIAIRNEPFRCGESYQFVTFDQRF